MVGGIALALQEMGVKVSGSDDTQFPPMPAVLREAGIDVNPAWSSEHVPADTDAVITGSLVFRWNPELEAALHRGIPVWNSTAFLERYFLQASENFVITGTKGKTTTTAMLAWILERAGKSPGFLIGGQIRDTAWPMVRLQSASPMVLEGDEYRCGYGDPLPKFHRYHARHLLITNVGHDHPEVFPTPLLYRDAFLHLVCSLPREATLTINADDPTALWLGRLTPTPVQSVGFSRRADFRITGFRESSQRSSFRLRKTAFRLTVPGRMNALNAGLAAVMAGAAGVSLEEAALGLRCFPGVEGRLEKITTVGRTVIYTDEAYLPMAIAPLLQSLRKRHPGRRIVFLFEPRHTGGRNGVCQKELPGCLAAADVVLMGPPTEITVYEQPFDQRLLCRELKRAGVEAVALKDLEDLDHVTAQALRHCRDGDILLGSFSLNRTGLLSQLITVLQTALKLRGNA